MRTQSRRARGHYPNDRRAAPPTFASTETGNQYSGLPRRRSPASRLVVSSIQHRRPDPAANKIRAVDSAADGSRIAPWRALAPPASDVVLCLATRSDTSSAHMPASKWLRARPHARLIAAISPPLTPVFGSSGAVTAPATSRQSAQSSGLAVARIPACTRAKLGRPSKQLYNPATSIRIMLAGAIRITVVTQRQRLRKRSAISRRPWHFASKVKTRPRVGLITRPTLIVTTEIEPAYARPA